MRNRKFPIVTLIAGAAILILVSGIAAVFSLSGGFSSNSLDRYPDFPMESYRNGDFLYSGNTYKICGVVDNVLAQSKDGKLFMLSLLPENSGAPLPIIVPSKLPKRPLQRQQRISLALVVLSNKALIATVCSPE